MPVSGGIGEARGIADRLNRDGQTAVRHLTVRQRIQLGGRHVRIVLLSAAYLGILTSTSVGIVRAYGDYCSFARKVAENNAMYCSATNPAALKRQAEIVTRYHHQAPHRSDSTILLLMGLGMSCLALWGSRRSPAR